MNRIYLGFTWYLCGVSLVFSQDISFKRKLLKKDILPQKVSDSGFFEKLLQNDPDKDKRVFFSHPDPVLVAPRTFLSAGQTVDADPTDVGLNLWGDATLFGTLTGLNAGFTGLSIPEPEILQSNLELRFTGITNGGTVDEPVISDVQWATQWERGAFGAANLDSFANEPVRLPFELWDVTNDRQEITRCTA